MLATLASRLLLALASLGVPMWALAQAPYIEPLTTSGILWQQALGGSAADEALAGQHLPDGTIVLAGATRSTDGLLAHRSRLDYDAWLVKLNYDGRVLWQRTYGGSYNEKIRAVKQTLDSGFLLVGYTQSQEYSKGGRDVLIIKVDALGQLEWLRAYGGRQDDEGAEAFVLPDGGYMIGGYTKSPAGDVRSPLGGSDAWVLRLDNRGNLIWEETFGGPGDDVINAGLLQNDGTYIWLGSTTSNAGGLRSHGAQDMFMFRMGERGQQYWMRAYGGSRNDAGHAIVRSGRNTYYVAGYTRSGDGDLRMAGYIRNKDVWVARFYPDDGALGWSRCYGGTGDDEAFGLTALPSGDLLVAGTSRSRDGNVSNNKGVFDGWLLQINGAGLGQWERSYGGFQNDQLHGVLPIAGGRLLGYGATTSTDGDLTTTATHGSSDFWAFTTHDPRQPIVKLQPAPTRFAGYVLDDSTNKPLPAELILVEGDNTLLARHRTDALTGLYQFSLQEARQRSLGVFAQGYLYYHRQVYIHPDDHGAELHDTIRLERIREGRVLVLNNILFDEGENGLLPPSLPELNRLLHFMESNPGLRIEVGGHTDDTGDPTTKEQLARLRALAVSNWLQSRGIRADRMEVVGYGASQPLADNTTAEGRRRNRRVEVKILPR